MEISGQSPKSLLVEELILFAFRLFTFFRRLNRSTRRRPIVQKTRRAQLFKPWQIPRAFQPEMIQEVLRHHKGHRSPRCHPTAAKADPFELQQLIDRAPAHRHAADLFNLSTRHWLVIGHDRKCFDGGST